VPFLRGTVPPFIGTLRVVSHTKCVVAPASRVSPLYVRHASPLYTIYISLIDMSHIYLIYESHVSLLYISHVSLLRSTRNRKPV
jgi:hypothetical protein